MGPSEQLHAYLQWLKERGLRHPVLRARAPSEAPPAAAARPESPAAEAPEAPEASENLAARIVFVSDGGMTPDERALLDKMIAAMRLAASDVAVTSAVKELPPPNRRLDRAAVEATRAGLKDLMARLEPELVIVMGAWTTRLLLGERVHFHDVHGHVHPCAALGVPILATYHPRDLLRFPANKRLAWSDLQVAMGKLGLH